MLPPSIRRLFRLELPRRPLAAEIEAELEEHLRRRAEALVAQGWEPDTARTEALRRFGPVPPVAAACRTIDQEREDRMIRREWWADLGQDLRYALRGLRKRPAATAVAALTFALGIGVNAAVFSLVDAVVLKPLPYAHADRVVRIYERDGRRETGQVTIADFRDWRDQATTFDAMAAFRWRSTVLNRDAENTVLTAAIVTAGFFDLLGVRPALGRTFVPEDEEPGAARVAVITDGTWRAHFGSDPAIVGGVARLDGLPTTIIGVLGPEFMSPMGDEVPVWYASNFEANARSAQTARRMHFLAVFGRLRPDVSLEAGAAELQAIGDRLEQAHPEQNAGHRPNAVPIGVAGIQSTRPALLLLMGAVGLILLIACANLANLIVARAIGRSREFAIRGALGAGRRRLARQVLTEQFVLAGLGAVIGLVTAAGAMQAMTVWLAPILPRAQRVGMDGRVLVFAVGITVVAAVVSGLLPALMAARSGEQGGLRTDGRGASTTRRGRRTRSLLVAAQVALAVVLLVGAGLVVRSLTRLLATDLGFRPESVLTFSVPLAPSRYPDAASRADLQLRLLEGLGALPGVVAAGAAYALPMQNVSTTSFDKLDQPFPPGEQPEIGYNTASAQLFVALGVPLLGGRAPDDQRDHADAPPVVVINQRMAEQFWPGANPIGQFVHTSADPNAPPTEIIGVVGDIRRARVDQAPTPEMYFSTFQDVTTNPSFVIRTRDTPEELTGAVRAVLRELDPTLPLARVATLREVVNQTLFRPRFMATLFSLLAGLALGLAGIGIYGVIAFIVAEQAQEIGIRRALGATAGQIRAQVLRQGMLPVLMGLATGLVLAVSLSGAIGAMLYDVAPTDLATLVSVVVVTVVAGLVGCLAPARRATRIEPLAALREG